MTVTVAPDTTPPAQADLSKITVSEPVNGQATTTGTAGSVEGNSQVQLTNPRTGQVVTVTANADGSFSAQVPAQAGDSLSIIVKDAAGNSSTATQIQIAPPSNDPLVQMDRMFKGIWHGMNAALVAGDKARALTYLTPNAQEKYGPVFDLLLPHMADIVASFTNFQAVKIRDHYAEYALNRTLNGENFLFLVYFLKDEHGVWKLESM